MCVLVWVWVMCNHRWWCYLRISILYNQKNVELVRMLGTKYMCMHEGCHVTAIFRGGPVFAVFVIDHGLQKLLTCKSNPLFLTEMHTCYEGVYQQSVVNFHGIKSLLSVVIAKLQRKRARIAFVCPCYITAFNWQINHWKINLIFYNNNNALYAVSAQRAETSPTAHPKNKTLS